MLCNGNAIRDGFRHGANAELKILANRIRMAQLRPVVAGGGMPGKRR
jgi:hypothetical protein